MSGTRWLRWGLLLVVVLGGCTRANPAYRGPQVDAATGEAGGGDAGVAWDGAGGDGGEKGDARGNGDGTATTDAGAETCVAYSKRCVANVLVKCEPDGSWYPLEECPSLCVENAAGPHCGGFYPSNDVPKCGHEDATLQPYVVEVAEQPTVFDTDSFTIVAPSGDLAWVASLEVDQGADAPKLAVFQFLSFEVPAGAQVVAVGSRALAIWSQGDVVIAGTVRAGAPLGASVAALDLPAGAWSPQSTWSGGAGVGAAAEEGSGGGGYGAEGGRGGKGGDGTLDGAAGGAGYGTEDLAPLRGGSPGGAPILATQPLVSGGGAIQIVACRSFTLRAGGAVSANGLGGLGGYPVVLPAIGYAGGSGGGSGGALLIESPRQILAAVLAANGGGGGGGLSALSGTTDATRGADGLEAEAAAPGGAPGGTNAGAGGAGGAKAAPAGGAGGDGLTTTASGGGGGGGVGRIRVNVTELDRVDLGVFVSGAVASPAPTSGKLAVW